MCEFQKNYKCIFTLDSSVFDEDIGSGKLQEVCKKFLEYT